MQLSQLASFGGTGRDTQFLCFLRCSDILFSKEVFDIVIYDNKIHP